MTQAMSAEGLEPRDGFFAPPAQPNLTLVEGGGVAEAPVPVLAEPVEVVRAVRRTRICAGALAELDIEMANQRAAEALWRTQR